MSGNFRGEGGRTFLVAGVVKSHLMRKSRQNKGGREKKKGVRQEFSYFLLQNSQETQYHFLKSASLASVPFCVCVKIVGN